MKNYLSPYDVDGLPPSRSYLYCMATECDDLFFKIGYSKSPSLRLGQIATGRGALMPPGWDKQPVTLLAVRPGTLADEKQIHHDLQQHRVDSTEWFMACQAVATYIIEQEVWVPWPAEYATAR